MTDTPHKLPIHTYPANKIGKDYIVGDIHGMLDAFWEALEAVHFNPDIDRVFSVGDLIDRGPKSLETLFLIRRSWFHPVRGNHEQMMLDAKSAAHFQNWLDNGGDWILREQGDSWVIACGLAMRMPHAIVIDDDEEGPIAITHSDPPVENWLDMPQSMQDEEQRRSLLWSRRRLREKSQTLTKNIRLTIHGHTPVEEVTRLGNALYIDTGCVYGGDLTILSVSDL